jgi:hypothetical protein
MTGYNTYSTTAANNINANTGINWDEGMNPGVVNNSARANMADARSAFNDLIWFRYGSGDGTDVGKVVYVSGNAFRINSVDVSTVYHKYRRVKAVGSSTGTIYGTISSVSFSTNTNVQVLWDNGGSLANETITVYLSQIPVTGTPWPGAFTMISMGTSFPGVSDGSQPTFQFATSSAGTNLKNSVIYGASGFLGFSTLSDDFATQTDFFTFSWSAGGKPSSNLTVTSLSVGANGTTNPALKVDGSAPSAATGITVTGRAAASGASISVNSSGTNENLTVDAKGSGTITLGGTSTGNITLTRATSASSTLAVTGKAGVGGAALTSQFNISNNSVSSDSIRFIDGAASGKAWLMGPGSGHGTTALTIAYNASDSILGPVVQTDGSLIIGGTTATGNGTLGTKVYTVGTLPTGAKGARSFVSDANSTTFATSAVGGGSNNVPVYHDGSGWRIG